MDKTNQPISGTLALYRHNTIYITIIQIIHIIQIIQFIQIKQIIQITDLDTSPFNPLHARQHRSLQSLVLSGLVIRLRGSVNIVHSSGVGFYKWVFACIMHITECVSYPVRINQCTFYLSIFPILYALQNTDSKYISSLRDDEKCFL